MPRKILAFISVIAVFIIIVVATQLKPQLLRIKEVGCQIDEQACPAKLIQRLEFIKGKSFLFSKLETDILSLDLNLFQLESISKSWPSTIALKFSYKPNSYIIKTTNQNKLFLVSENGLAQPISTEQNLPLIEVYNWKNSIQENFVEEQLHNLNLSLIQFLATQKISYKNIKIQNPQEIEILLQKDLVVLVQKDDLESQIIKLSIILNELDLNAIDLQINTIDLRFDFPLLKTNSSTQS
jgi:hypothetical protein